MDIEEMAGDVSQMDDVARQWLYDPTVAKIATVVIGFFIIALVVRFFQRKVVNRFVSDTDMRYRARKISTFVGYFFGLLFAATVFSAQFSKLTVAFGIAGAGIAFALQEVIVSLAGWIAIVFGDYYKTGDRVLLGGIKGDVIDIGMLRTTLMECGDWIKADQYNGRIVRIANSYVFKEPVYNYSHDFPFLWDEVEVPVKFGSDHRLAREILQKVAAEVVGEYVDFAQKAWKRIVDKYRIEDARVQPMITMVFDENWMSFTLRYVVDFKARRSTKDRLFTRVMEEFEQTQGRVQIAASGMEINLTNAPELGVRFANGGMLK